MLQRLGLAAALLGDPPILVLDEPLNGLDPEGIIWFRDLMRQMAAEGRTVLVSSHLMAEMSVTADHLLIIGEGRLLVDSEMETFERDHEHEEIQAAYYCFPVDSASRASAWAARKNLLRPRSPTVLTLNACCNAAASVSETPARALTGLEDLL
jgi:ABC-type multidrug transport system ATPase subunit